MEHARGTSHPFRFTGKELDRQNGLKMYDFGARWYDVAGVPMWTSIDPLCEKYYGVSPYAFCNNNPVNAVDLEGMEPIYDTAGKFLGCTKEGFTGQIYIYKGFGNIDFSGYALQDLLNSDEAYFIMRYEDVATSHTGEARENFVSNVMTNIVTHFNGIDVFGTRFDVSTLNECRIHSSNNPALNFTTSLNSDEGIKITSYNGAPQGYESTVENLASTLIIHEWYGHGILKYGDHHKNYFTPAPNHRIVYDNVMKYAPLFDKTTPKYKLNVIENYIIFSIIENQR